MIHEREGRETTSKGFSAPCLIRSRLATGSLAYTPAEITVSWHTGSLGIYDVPIRQPTAAMKMAFVGVFYASLQHPGRHGELALCAKRKGDQNAQRAPGNKHEITYRLPPYTYTQNPEDFAHLKDASKVAAAMWRDYVENSGQMEPSLNRPLRHYPAHYYKRQIKQKIGLQRKEAKIKKILEEATIPKPKDDFTNLHPIHHERILDAFDRLEAWQKVAQARQPQVEKPETSKETEDAISQLQQELKQSIGIETTGTDDHTVDTTYGLAQDDDYAFGGLNEFNFENTTQDDLDDDISIPDYGEEGYNEIDYSGINMNEDEYYGGEYDDDDESTHMGVEDTNEFYDTAEEDQM